MGKIIDFEYFICPTCGYRATKTFKSMLYPDKECPKCNKGQVQNWPLVTSNPEKYKEGNDNVGH